MGGQGNVRMVYTFSNIAQYYITLSYFFCDAEMEVQMIVQLGD